MLVGSNSPAIRHLRIGIVDALTFFRAGLVEFLRKSDICQDAIQGQSAEDAIRMAAEEDLDLIFLDPEVSANGGQAVKKILQDHRNLLVVILTNSEDPRNIMWAMGQGVRGYILRNVGETELKSAIRSISEGDVYLTPSLGARVMAQKRSPDHSSNSGFKSLTAREKKILAVLAQGATNKQIAQELNVAEATIKYFMTSIMQKLKVRNRLEAALEERRRLAVAEEAPLQQKLASFGSTEATEPSIAAFEPFARSKRHPAKANRLRFVGGSKP